MTLKQLSARIRAGAIDTILVVFPDVFGRLIGKRMTALSIGLLGHGGTSADGLDLRLRSMILRPERRNSPDHSNRASADRAAVNLRGLPCRPATLRPRLTLQCPFDGIR